MPDADVVVVGAGPAGAASALLFARAGFHTVLLDRAHFPRPKACAEYMSPGVVTTLADLGILGAVRRLEPCEVHGMDIVSPRGAVFATTYDSWSPGAVAWTLPRLRFDAALVREAVASGVELREGFVARRTVREGERVTGITGTWNGDPAALHAPLTIVADGARSILARQLQIDSSPRWPRRLGLVAHFSGHARLQPGRGQMHVADGGYCGIAPLPGGMLNVAVVSRLGAPSVAGLNATAFFERWIGEHPAVCDALDGCDRVTPVRGVGPIGARTTRAWAPGCLLVGDSASFFDPFTGEGIFRALQGGILAARVGIPALRDGSVGRSGLAPYAALRRGAFARKSAVTALVQLFVQYPRLMEYALPRLQAREVPATTLSAVLGDIEPAGTFLRPSMLWATLRP